jgi:hypothetical protein
MREVGLKLDLHGCRVCACPHDPPSGLPFRPRFEAPESSSSFQV